MGLGPTHVCGAIPSMVPDVVNQGGQVLQAVRDVVWKEQETHGLKDQSLDQQQYF